MTIAPNSSVARDIAYLTHPTSNFREHEKAGSLIIERGEGIYVYDDQGNKHLEASELLQAVVAVLPRQMIERVPEEVDVAALPGSFGTTSPIAATRPA